MGRLFSNYEIGCSTSAKSSLPSRGHFGEVAPYGSWLTKGIIGVQDKVPLICSAGTRTLRHMSNTMPDYKEPVITQLLYRRRDAAVALGVSESQIDIWSRSGVLRPIHIPGIRAVRFAREDVEALALSWRNAAGGAKE